MEQNTMKLTFNNKAILTGYLEQMLPHFDGIPQERMMVGALGGLGYKLFRSEDLRLIPKMQVYTRSDLKLVAQYNDALDRYLECADAFTKKNNGLLSRYDDAGVFCDFTDESSIYTCAITQPQVQSPDDMKKFLGQLSKGQSELDSRFGAVSEISKEVYEQFKRCN